MQQSKNQLEENSFAIQEKIKAMLSISEKTEDLADILDNFMLAYLMDVERYGAVPGTVSKHFYVFKNLQKCFRQPQESIEETSIAIQQTIEKLLFDICDGKEDFHDILDDFLFDWFKDNQDCQVSFTDIADHLRLFFSLQILIRLVKDPYLHTA